MQLFIKMPCPYNKTFAFEINNNDTFTTLKDRINSRTVYSNLKYYLIFGRNSMINEENEHLTIDEYNELFPNKKISNEQTITLNIRSKQ